MMTDLNTFRAKASDQAAVLAKTMHAEGADVRSVAAAVASRLADSGGFGKELDRQTRRIVRAATGVELQPGEGSGRIAPDGAVSYRR